MTKTMIHKKRQAHLVLSMVSNDALDAADNALYAPRCASESASPSVAEVATFKFQINDFLWSNNSSLDYYKLVDAVNASIHAASDKAAKMVEWRVWATETRLALRYLDELVDLGHNNIGVSAMELMWNVKAFNERIIPAWSEFDALRQGLKTSPQMVNVDESGQAFDDNYLPFEPVEQS